MEALKQRIGESGGPPPGVNSHGIEILFDESQGTAVVLQRFPSASDMQEAARVLGAMGASDTPGTRASVDACEGIIELSA